MTFWTPINGATAGGSSSPRAELREMLDPTNLGVTWSGAGESVQDALLKVMQVPRDGIVIVGQVHGYGSAPLILLYYRYDFAKQTGRVIAKLQGLPEQGPPYTNHVLATDIALGETFSYQMKVSHNVAMASANGGPVATMAMDPAWNSETFYFKAGAYLHMHGDSATEGARVKFYRLAASHPNDGLFVNSPAAPALPGPAVRHRRSRWRHLEAGQRPSAGRPDAGRRRPGQRHPGSRDRLRHRPLVRDPGA